MTRVSQSHPLVVGSEPVLLLDQSTVEDSWGVRRILNVPIKDPRNPVLMPDLPWEGGAGQANVLHDEAAGLFRMWYTCMDWNAWLHQFRFKDWNAQRDGYPYYVCYAQSVDGVHWEKPLSEDRPYLQHRRTNIVLTGEQKAQAARVTWNPPGTNRPERFLMTFKDNRQQGNGAFCLAYSDDGIHWCEDERNPAFVGARDAWQNMIYDPRQKHWLLYTRPTCHAGCAKVPGGPVESNYKRRIAVMVGLSPFNFGRPRMVLTPQEVDEPDFDHMVVSRVGSQFLGFLGQMGPAPRMPLHLHLAFSSDGLDWRQLPDRPEYLPHGEPGAFDAGSVSAVGGVVECGDTCYIYYRGSVRGQAQGNKNNLTGIGRAQFLRDRYIAQMGAHTGGFLLTREMLVTGPRLIINTTIADGYQTDPATSAIPAELAVEILQPNDAGCFMPVAGYTLADCTTPAVDMLDLEVTWKTGHDLSPMIGQPIMIRFYLKNVGVYSFRFST